ncbi:MAG: hypothetical protein ACKOFI_08475, partial [Phycisphaerales bacterium]
MRVAVLNVVGLSPSVFARRKSPALQAFAQRSGGIRTLEPDFPAVTCTVQSSRRTVRSSSRSMRAAAPTVSVGADVVGAASE